MSISDSRPFPFYLGPASTSSSKDETIANVNFSADGTLSMPELHAAVGLKSPAYIAPGTPRVSAIPDHANVSDSTTGTVQFQSPPTISYESSTITIESNYLVSDQQLTVQSQFLAGSTIGIRRSSHLKSLSNSPF